MAAVLSADMQNIDKIVIFVEECRRMELPLNLPNVNESHYKFTVNAANQVVYGLGAVKGVGEGPVDLILDERKNNGSYKSLFDFTSRLDLTKVNRRVVESLVRSGAFDKIEPNRASLLASVSLAIKMAEQSKNEVGQEGLFGGSDIEAIKLVESWDTQKQLLEEKEALGFYFSGHPFIYYKKIIKSFISTKLIDPKTSTRKLFDCRYRLIC